MQSETETASNKITIGRFAPSPTGPLHFGSLVAAVASYLCARQHPESQWLLRIEDVDTGRKQKGATSSIIKTLETFGFKWDSDIVYQSKRSDLYALALSSLADMAYPCSCTRKELNTLSNISSYGYTYPGICRDGQSNPKVSNPSIRLRTNNKVICFQDQCQSGQCCQTIERDIGDFILKRRDGLFAYQLAVVVDDHLQGVNHVVRGADLFDNTPRQIYLQQQLGYQTPEYCHFPVATTADGKKLSKQNASAQVESWGVEVRLKNLIKALDFLGQNPPDVKHFSSIEDVWVWAFKHWHIDNIPKTKEIVLT